MPTLDETTPAMDAARRPRGSRPATRSLGGARLAERRTAWCDVCGSLSCRHVLEAVTTRPLA